MQRRGRSIQTKVGEAIRGFVVHTVESLLCQKVSVNTEYTLRELMCHITNKLRGQNTELVLHWIA